MASTDDPDRVPESVDEGWDNGANSGDTEPAAVRPPELEPVREEAESEIDRFEREAEFVADEGERTALLARCARMHTEAGDRDRASRAWERVLEICPEHVAALQSLVEIARASEDATSLTIALQRLLDRAARLLGDEEILAIVTELVELRADAGEWAEAAELLANKLDRTTERSERAPLFRRIAKVLDEEIDDAEQAFDVLHDGLREDLADEATMAELELLAKKTGRFAELLSTVAASIEEPSVRGDRALTVRLLQTMARWYDAELSQPIWAVECLEQAAALGLYDVRPAIALGKMHRDAGRHGPAFEVLTSAVERAVDPEQRRQASIELGEISEIRGDFANAARHLAAAKESDPTDLRVLRGLSRVYPKLAEWARLRDVLELRLERAETDEERAEVMLALAQVLEVHFLDHDRASQLLERVIELDDACELAFASLPRCYGKLRLWDAALHAHERHLSMTTRDDVQLDAYLAIARICAEELGVLDRALDAYQSALEIDPYHLASLEGAVRLYERADDVESVLLILGRLVDATSEPRGKAEILHRMATIHEQRLGDDVEARALSRASLELEPDFVPALALSRKLAADVGEWHEAARLLEREQRCTASPRARARLLVELGSIRRDRLDDAHGALHAFEEAHALDAENDHAAWPVAAAMVERCEYERAEPIVERLARAAGRRDRSERNRIFDLHGRVLSALGKHKRALDAFRAARDADPSDAEALRGLADAAWNVGDHAAALDAHRKLLTTLGSLGEEDDALRVEALYRIGSMHGGLGDAKKAVSHLERALEVNPSHRDSLRALVALHEAKGSHRDAIEYKRRILESTDEESERCALLCEIADTWAEREHDPRKAAEAIEEALTIVPDDRRLLLRLLRHREAASLWPQVCETIEHIVSIEDDKAIAAKYLYTEALLHLERMNDVATASDCLERALDFDPQHPKAFVRLQEIARAARDWPRLARSLRRMIDRISSGAARDPDLEFALWHALGELHRDRLGDLPASIEAFRRASDLRPDDSQERCRLAETYCASDQLDLAVDELRAAIDRDPSDAVPYRGLYALFTRTGQLDRAWCVASALVLMGCADREQTQCFEALRPQGVPPFSAPLDEQTWRRRVFAPQQEPRIGEIFEIIVKAARAAKRKALFSRGSLPPLPAQLRQGPESDYKIAKVFFGGARVLGLSAPELYVRSDLAGGLGILPTDPRASVVGSTLLTGFSVPELAYLVGEHLAHQRDELTLAALFPSLTELRALFMAAISIVVPARDPEIANMARVLGNELSEGEREALRHHVERFVASGREVDVLPWLHATSITATRAGFIFSGDLRAAVRMIRQQPVVPGDLSPGEKVKELLRYVVSEDYAAVRVSLGIAMNRPTSVVSDDDDDDEPTLERKIA